MNSTKRNVLFSICAVSGLLFVPGFVFAENATPDGKWNFTFVDPKMIHLDSEKYMTIPYEINLQGTESMGTVIVNAVITDPDGEIFTLSETIRDMTKETHHSSELVKRIYKDGQYVAELSMIPPPGKYHNHVFDTHTVLHTVTPGTFEIDVGSVITERNDGITFTIENVKVADLGIVHVTMDLPQDHLYGEIVTENEGFKHAFPINTKSIYLTSEEGYGDLKIHLNEDNLLPSADAQSIFQDFVKFKATDNTVCYSTDCVNIDKKSEDFPLIIPISVIVTIIAIISTVLYTRKRKAEAEKNHDDAIIVEKDHWTSNGPPIINGESVS